MSEFVLCYIEGNRAFFTSQVLESQWGDDWNDAPYEHNAGCPYRWYENNSEPEYQIIDLYFDVSAYNPAEWYNLQGIINSPLSVEGINRGDFPWLIMGESSQTRENIYAGVTLEEFKRRIKEAGGSIYIKEE